MSILQRIIPRVLGAPRIMRQALMRPRYGVAPSSTRGTITRTLLAGNSSTTDGTSVASASHTPTNGSLVLAAISSHNAAGPNQPTASGNGQTWDVVSSQLLGTARRITVFRCLVASSSAGATTFDFGGQTQTAFAWSIVEFANIDTSGTNGSGAIVQTTSVEVGSTTTHDSDLAALENANNVHYCATVLNINGTVTADADFALLHSNGAATTAVGQGTEWAANQTRCSPSYSTASARTISIEVKAS